jgi:hypothetical protein
MSTLERLSANDPGAPRRVKPPRAHTEDGPDQTSLADIRLDIVAKMLIIPETRQLGG